MKYTVIFSPGAEDDLDEIEQYLALRFSERNAERFVLRIVAHCLSLALAPHCGTLRDDVWPGLRIIGFDRRVTISFQVRAESVVIVGISYAGRSLELDR